MVRLSVPGILDSQDIMKAYENFDLSYMSQVKSREKQREQETNWWRDNKHLSRAIAFAAGTEKEELRTVLQTLQAELDRRIVEAREQETATKTAVENKYKKYLHDTDDFMQKRVDDAQNKREDEYQKNLKLMQTSNDLKVLSSAQNFFRSIQGYKDSNALIEQCREKIETLIAASQKRQQNREKRNKMLGILFAVIAIAAIIIAYVMFNTVIPANRYETAVSMFEAGNYEEAYELFSALGNYKDADLNAQYAKAESLAARGNDLEAALTFGKIASFRDARERSLALWPRQLDSIAAGSAQTVALKSNGTVVLAGYNDHGDVSGWTDIVAVAAGSDQTVGLKANGTVIATGRTNDAVRSWSDIVSIAAGSIITAGLKSDGTVVSTGSNECDVSGWTDIVAIAVGYGSIIGLKLDGTVVATGNNDYGQCDVTRWSDIVAISAGWSMYTANENVLNRTDEYLPALTVGLRSDGTVVTTAPQGKDRYDVSGWSDIVDVETNGPSVFGVRKNGRVEMTGQFQGVYDWTNIVSFAAGDGFVAGLRSNGMVVATGTLTADGQCNVSDWTNIVVPKR